MGQWYAYILGAYGILAIWALWNFKMEVDEIRLQWNKLRQSANIAEEVKYTVLHSKLCWLIMIVTAVLALTGLGAVLAPFSAIFIVYWGISRAQLPNPGPLVHAISMFALDLFFTTGGAGLVELGAVIGTGGAGFGSGVIVVLISNIMSIMFFLPKKGKSKLTLEQKLAKIAG